MRARLRPHLSYANVMSTLAVFIALGGSSYAAVTLSGSNIKSRSISGAKLKRSTITNVEVRESRLGRVPRAYGADRLIDTTELPARLFTAAELRDRCPPGTLPAGGTCVERDPRVPAAYQTAVDQCGNSAPGRRLPSHGELKEALKAVPLAPGGELTSSVFPSTAYPGQLDVLYVTDGIGRVAMTSSAAEGAKAYRCAIDPTNR